MSKPSQQDITAPGTQTKNTKRTRTFSKLTDSNEAHILSAYDWQDCKRLFFAGFRVGDLARRFRISPTVLTERIKTEAWLDQRLEFYAMKKIQEKVHHRKKLPEPPTGAETLLETDIVDLTVRQEAVLQRHKDAWPAVDALRALAETSKNPDLMRLVKQDAEILRIIQAGERLAWGIVIEDPDAPRTTNKVLNVYSSIPLPKFEHVPDRDLAEEHLSNGAIEMTKITETNRILVAENIPDHVVPGYEPPKIDLEKIKWSEMVQASRNIRQAEKIRRKIEAEKREALKSIKEGEALKEKKSESARPQGPSVAVAVDEKKIDEKTMDSMPEGKKPIRQPAPKAEREPAPPKKRPAPKAEKVKAPKEKPVDSKPERPATPKPEGKPAQKTNSPPPIMQPPTNPPAEIPPVYEAIIPRQPAQQQQQGQAQSNTMPVLQSNRNKCGLFRR